MHYNEKSSFWTLFKPNLSNILPTHRTELLLFLLLLGNNVLWHLPSSKSKETTFYLSKVVGGSSMIAQIVKDMATDTETV